MQKETQLAEPVTVVFPSRWVIRKDFTYEDTVKEVDHLAQILVRSSEAIAGVYMRLTDLIRHGSIPDQEVRKILSQHFPSSRVAEILRVSRAPEETYARYIAGFFGFKAALRECRGYQITPEKELKTRQARRAAQRLITLLGESASIRVKGAVITIVPEEVAP